MREFLATTRDWLVTCALTCLTVGGSIVLAILLGVTDGFPHTVHSASGTQEYAGICCNGNALTGDCQPIPRESVKPIEGGFQVTLSPGDHHMVTRVHVFQVEMTKVRWSTDGRYHACLYPNEDHLQCFYAPPQGS